MQRRKAKTPGERVNRVLDGPELVAERNDATITRYR